MIIWFLVILSYEQVVGLSESVFDEKCVVLEYIPTSLQIAKLGFIWVKAFTYRRELICRGIITIALI